MCDQLSRSRGAKFPRLHLPIRERPNRTSDATVHELVGCGREKCKFKGRRGRKREITAALVQDHEATYPRLNYDFSVGLNKDVEEE